MGFKFSRWIFSISAMAAATRTLRFTNSVYVAPARQLFDDLSQAMAGMWAFAGGELIQRVARGVAALGDKYVSIFWMRYLEGYTETEIAEKLGVSDILKPP